MAWRLMFTDVLVEAPRHMYGFRAQLFSEVEGRLMRS